MSVPKTKIRITLWMSDEQYLRLKTYCEEARVTITAAIDEAVEDFLVTSAAERLATVRATREAKRNPN
jgi:hypothetical protein